MANTSNSIPLSPAPTLVAETTPSTKEPSPEFSFVRKYSLLALFCLAQFLDAFNISAIFSGIPTLVSQLGINAGEGTWIISGYGLTFASFLLVSGKISDVYNPKYTFVLGSFALAAISLGTGFVNDKIVLIVLRAFGGIAGSMTIPSALSMLVHIFRESNEQARALSLFGGFAAMGNVLGLVIGALLVQYTSWRWIFWFVAIAAAIMSVAVTFLAPSQPAEDIAGPHASKLRRLDLPGVTTLTAALILLIFGVTSSSTSGWGSATVLAPLIISVAVFVAFFFWEARLPAAHAAIPSEIWFYTNFSVLFGVALLPFLWWTSVFTNFVTLWQDIYHWSAISTAVHLLPIGGIAFVFGLSSSLANYVDPKYLILAGNTLQIAGTIVLALANEPSKYASHAVPGFILGSGGSMLVFTQTNIAIFRTAPVSMSGTIGAIFNSALQVGGAVGIAAVTSIQTSVDSKPDHHDLSNTHDTFKGRAASFWFLLGLIAVQAISVAIFYRTKKSVASSTKSTPVDKEIREEVEVKRVESV